MHYLATEASYINRSDNHWIVSTSTFVTLGVILAMTGEAWGQHKSDLSGRKTPPSGRLQTRLQKRVEGSIGCCFCCADIMSSHEQNSCYLTNLKGTGGSTETILPAYDKATYYYSIHLICLLCCTKY